MSFWKWLLTHDPYALPALPELKRATAARDAQRAAVATASAAPSLFPPRGTYDEWNDGVNAVAARAGFVFVSPFWGTV